MPIEQREFLGLRFDLLSQDAVLARLAEAAPHAPYGFVVTPNVDHLVRLHEERDLKAIYDEAELCLCDSRILRLIARLKGVALPVVPGSELTKLMFDKIIRRGDRIAVVGGDSELLTELEQRFAAVEFVQHCPPMGLRRNAAARRAAAEFVAHGGARYTFIAVGSPQQEMIAAEAKSIPGAAGTALCVGAALNFLVGREKRAPRLAQQLGLEWAHRLLSNPRRLWRRYLVEGPRIFVLAFRWHGQGQQGALTK